MDTILIIGTGGTIDKVYFDALSEYQVGDPAAAEILSHVHCRVPLRIVSLFRKDSLEITDQDRQKIVDEIQAATELRVLVTHGTDTMAQTAQCVQQALGEHPKKSVVLTGALLPGAFRDSDAVFNIGVALGALQAMEGGVKLAMNGRLFDPAYVRKNRKASCFETWTGESL